MDTAKLQRIIERKNERLEDTAVRTADALIEGIIGQQRRIKEAEEAIVELRKELASLEISQLDADEILEG